MKFGIFYEHQLPRPWAEGDELQLVTPLGIEKIEVLEVSYPAPKA